MNSHIKLIVENKISDPDVILTLLKGKRMRAGLLLLVMDILSLPYDIAAHYGELYVHMLAETHRGMVSGVVRCVRMKKR